MRTVRFRRGNTGMCLVTFEIERHFNGLASVVRSKPGIQGIAVRLSRLAWISGAAVSGIVSPGRTPRVRQHAVGGSFTRYAIPIHRC
jgi:hypothetical protein